MSPGNEAVTPIGVDRGEYNRYVAYPAEIDDWSEAYASSGSDICTQLDELRDRIATLLAGRDGADGPKQPPASTAADRLAARPGGGVPDSD